LIILSFEGGKVLPYYFFTEEEAKTPFLTGFFYIKKKAPLFRGALPFIKANCRNFEE